MVYPVSGSGLYKFVTLREDKGDRIEPVGNRYDSLPSSTVCKTVNGVDSYFYTSFEVTCNQQDTD